VIETLVEFCAKDIQAIKLTDKVSDAVQRSLLANAPDIVVSTPSRAWTNISSSAMSVEKLTHVVVDEADLVLSYGYEEDLQNVARRIPKGVQTILTSATLTTEVDTLKGMFCRDPVVLDLEEKDEDGEGVSQYVVKYVVLLFKILAMLEANDMQVRRGRKISSHLRHLQTEAYQRQKHHLRRRHRPLLPAEAVL